jgi:hypothetical protein
MVTMKKTYFLIILHFFFSCNLQSQTWEWLQDFNSVHFSKTVIDDNGNSFTIIQFKDSINEVTYISPYGEDSLHTKIIKRNSNNILLWEKGLYCSGLSYPKIVFKNNSEAYLTGSFSGSLSSNDFNLTSNGERDIFLILIDNSGQFSVQNHFGGPGDEQGECAFDSRGYLIVAGGYTNSGTFGNLIYTGNTSQDFFLLQFDTNNNLVWSERAITPNTGGYCYGEQIKTDSQNNIYVTVSGDAILENNGSRVGAYYAAELCKFNSSGNYRNTFQIGSSYPYRRNQGWEIDDAGNVYYASVGGSAHTSYTSNIVKQDSLAQILWQNHYGVGDYGTPDFCITGFHLDKLGNYYFTAVGDSIVGATKKFIAKGNADDGSIIWKYYLEITHPQLATIETDANNNVYVASYFWDTLTIGSYSLFSIENTFFNPFLVKLAAEPIGISGKNATEALIFMYPNPSNGVFSILLPESNSKGDICIYDILGNCLQIQQITEAKEQVLDMSHNTKGVYFIEVQTGKERYNAKLIIN